METIDFTRIRSLSEGQRYSFEELVCQLARRQSVPTGSTFSRVEGSGGDGGVEGYWLLPNGSKYGYQAKYFTRSREIDWSQIDDSVEEALKNHPSLTQYVIAIPCDLTDRSGATGRGRTGWEHWQAHRAKWLARAADRHARVDFVPWTGFELRNALIAPSADGLRRYWFGFEELSSEWFARKANAAIVSLDERYNPEDHVDVSLERLFGFVCRKETAIKQLTDAVLKIENQQISDRYVKHTNDGARLADLTAISNAVDAVVAIKPEFNLPIWEAWELSNWKTLLPAPWLASALSLKQDKSDTNKWLDPQGSVCFQTANSEDGTSVLIKADVLDAFSEKSSLACVWLFAGERGAWPGGNNNSATWRRSEGACWLERKTPKFIYWNRDSGNRRDRKREKGAVKRHHKP